MRMYQGKHAAPVTGIRRKVLLSGAFVLVVGLGSVLRTRTTTRRSC
ncbi:hypothetical protein WEI85_48325 [Actinomycetes bacterium KLBMP 9797]